LSSLGVAQAIPAGRANKPDVIKEAIVKALEDPSYRLAATHCRRMMRDHCPTLAQTAELIETGLGRLTPLHRDDPEVNRILGIAAVANLTLSQI
jgi:UDP:flavonoid glycosyltransferase YjiC (YdhE family)